MQLQKLAVVCLAISSALAGNANAKKLDTIAGSVELPFEFQVKDKNDSATNGTYGYSASQSIHIAIDSGPLKGHEAKIGVSYYAPTRVDSGVVQGWVQKAAEDAAAKPGSSDILPIQLAGFPFILLTTNAVDPKAKKTDASAAAPAATSDATTTEIDKDAERITSMSGSINNSMLTIAFSHPKNAEFDAMATKAIKELNLDFASVLKLRSRFDVASQGAVVDKKMIAPTGDYSTVDDLVPRLYEIFVKTDGNGKPLAEKVTYYLSKMGFWTLQRMIFSSYCSLEDGQDAKKMAKLRDVASDTDKAKVVIIDGPTPIKFGGLGATRITTKHTSKSPGNSGDSDGTRLIATDNDTYYVVDFETTGGASIERNLTSQIDSRPLVCKPKALLTLGAAASGSSGSSSH
jgi:hypothetical protein